ncbi:MAG: hypothetical protein LBG61_00575 [Burkholderiales bacterium]|jgi:hypothetical protein|nr:hypothetical protein [Burkholderiales bacterium]
MAKNLEAMQPLYNMLADAALRKKSLGSKILFIDDVALKANEELNHKDWENVHFKEVEFYGRFDMGNLKNVTFEKCFFMGREGDGIGDGMFVQGAEDVTFVKCETHGQVYLMGYGAKNLVFEACDFTDQPNTDDNKWGAVCYEGEVLYKKCKAEHIDISGKGTVHYDGCEFTNMEMSNGQHSEKPEKRKFAEVLIENCAFKGEVDMQIANIASLTMRNTTFETILTPESLRDNLTLENVKGNYLWFQAADLPLKNITVKNCEFFSKGNKIPTFRIYKKGDKPVHSETLTIDGIKYDLKGLQDTAGDVYQAAEKNTQIKNIEMSRIGLELRGGKVQMDNIKCGAAIFETPTDKPTELSLSNINIERKTKFTGVKLTTLTIDGYHGDTLDLKDAKIGRLEIRNSRVETLLDLTNAQVGSGDFATLTGSKKIKVITKGSNLDVKDGTLYVVPPKKA